MALPQPTCPLLEPLCGMNEAVPARHPLGADWELHHDREPTFGWFRGPLLAPLRTAWKGRGGSAELGFISEAADSTSGS